LSNAEKLVFLKESQHLRLKKRIVRLFSRFCQLGNVRGLVPSPNPFDTTEEMCSFSYYHGHKLHLHVGGTMRRVDSVNTQALFGHYPAE
jgi:hypothetical protein